MQPHSQAVTLNSLELKSGVVSVLSSRVNTSLSSSLQLSLNCLPLQTTFFCPKNTKTTSSRAPLSITPFSSHFTTNRTCPTKTLCLSLSLFVLVPSSKNRLRCCIGRKIDILSLTK